MGKTTPKDKEKLLKETDKERVKEVVPPDQPLPKTGNEDLPTPPPPTQPGLRCGYYIGITEDGGLKFDIMGSEKYITDLLGLHEVAGERIQNIIDKHQGGKFSYIAKRMATVEGKLDQLLEIMGQLTAMAVEEEDSEQD